MVGFSETSLAATRLPKLAVVFTSIIYMVLYRATRSPVIRLLKEVVGQVLDKLKNPAHATATPSNRMRLSAVRYGDREEVSMSEPWTDNVILTKQPGTRYRPLKAVRGGVAESLSPEFNLQARSPITK